LSEPDKTVVGDYTVYCGVDVGKSEHHACALDPAGKRLHDRALPNDEAALRTVLSGLQVHGRVLVIVDQPAAIGALVIAVARSRGGLEFDSFDGKPIRILFILMGYRRDYSLHVKALARLALLIKKMEFIEKIGASSSAQDMIRAFNEADARIC